MDSDRQIDRQQRNDGRPESHIVCGVCGDDFLRLTFSDFLLINTLQFAGHFNQQAILFLITPGRVMLEISHLRLVSCPVACETCRKTKSNINGQLTAHTVSFLGTLSRCQYYHHRQCPEMSFLAVSVFMCSRFYMLVQLLLASLFQTFLFFHFPSILPSCDVILR